MQTATAVILLLVIGSVVTVTAGSLPLSVTVKDSSSAERIHHQQDHHDSSRPHTAIITEHNDHNSLLMLLLRHRYLARGDFESLNVVLASVQLAIDESPVILETVAGSTLEIALSNITCRALQLGNVVIDWQQQQDTTTTTTTTSNNNIHLTNTVQLQQVDLDCSMLYTYSYLFFSGSGGLDLMTADNTIVTTNDITGSSSSSIISSSTKSSAAAATTTNVNMTSCRASIQIQDMVFDGDGLGILGSALTTIEGLVRSTVADKMQTYLCEFVGQFQEPLQSGLTQFMRMVDANSTAYEPLRIESKLRVPRAVDLVSTLR